MPELPEVETVARGLQRAIAGRRILSVTLGKTDFMDDPEAIEQQLPGRRIERVERYGKFMLLRLSANEAATAKDSGLKPAAANAGTNGTGAKCGSDTAPALLVHLGMTGNFSVHPAAQPWEKHTHACFVLEDGRELRYTDPRRFGRMAYLEKEPLSEELERFGTDPLEITTEEFTERIRNRRARIKALLLDQSVLRGVGNIYADESLWRAKIHPAKLGARMTPSEAKLLRRKLQEVLRKAIELRGSSISDFVGAEGRPGEYQRHHRAYGREGKKCYRCGMRIRRAIVAGRSSYFCPRCQPAPKSRAARKIARNA